MISRRKLFGGLAVAPVAAVLGIKDEPKAPPVGVTLGPAQVGQIFTITNNSDQPITITGVSLQKFG